MRGGSTEDVSEPKAQRTRAAAASQGSSQAQHAFSSHILCPGASWRPEPGLKARGRDLTRTWYIGCSYRPRALGQNLGQKDEQE